MSEKPVFLLFGNFWCGVFILGPPDTPNSSGNVALLNWLSLEFVEGKINLPGAFSPACRRAVPRLQ